MALATIRIYGSDTLIEETYPLKTAVEALSDVVYFDLEALTINAQPIKEFEVIDFLGGLQLSFSSKSLLQYSPNSIEFAYPKTDKTDIREYYDVNVLDKRYHYADFSQYNLLPAEVIASIGGSLKLMAVNLTEIGITHIPERGTKTKSLAMNLREFD